MKVVLSHPGVAPFVQEASRALYEQGWLQMFHTSFAYRAERSRDKVLRAVYGLIRRDADAQLRRRSVQGIPDEFLRTHPIWEVLRVIAGRIGGDVIGDRVWERTELAFDRSVASELSSDLTAVYGYEHSSLATFRRAKQLGLKVYYDMPAPHHRLTTEVLEREYKKFPELRTPHYRHTRSQTPRRNARRDEELAHADFIVCASALTERSLLDAGVAPERLLRVPYGMPPPSSEGAQVRGAGPLRFLYAGTLSVRKGVHHLLEACRRVRLTGDAELWMIGANSLPVELLADLPRGVRVLPSVPRQELFRLYHEADLLIFPTLLDGFGMVLTEALSCGLPVLTTPRAGSADFIEHEANGFVVSPADPDAIAGAMDWSLSHPERLRSMRKACVATAGGWQWSDYRQLLADRIGCLGAGR